MAGFALGGFPALLICGEPLLAVFSFVAAVVGKWAHSKIPLANVQSDSQSPAKKL